MAFSVPEFESDGLPGSGVRPIVDALPEVEPVRTAADILGQGFWAFGHRSGKFSVSPRTLELIGSDSFSSALSPESLRRFQGKLAERKSFELIVEIGGGRVLLKGWPDDPRGERAVGTVTSLPNDLRAAAMVAPRETLLTEAMEYGPDSLLVLQAVRDELGVPVDFEVVESNSKGAQLLGYDRDEVKGELIGQLLPSARENGLIEQYAAVMESGQSSEQEFHVEPGGFQRIWIRQRVVPLRDGVAVFASDVSKMRRADETADRSRRMFERIASTTPDALLLWDVDTKRVLYHNREQSALLGLADSTGTRTYLSGIERQLDPEDVGPFREHLTTVAAKEDDSAVETELRFGSGEEVRRLLLRSSVLDRKGDSRPKTILTSAEDVTERVSQNTELEERNRQLNEERIELLGLNLILRDQTRTDALTGVKNRRGFDDRIEEEVERAKRQHQPLALLMIDLDDFKTFNNEFGHPVGDKVLKEFARILVGARRVGDTVSRYGGEEFAITLPNTSAQDAVVVGERIRSNLLGLVVNGKTVTASIGVSQFKDDKEKLIAEADEALYRSKANGKDQVSVF